MSYADLDSARFLTSGGESSHYFSESNIKFWHSKVYTLLSLDGGYKRGGRFIALESVKAFGLPRSYRVLVITPSGAVIRWGDMEFKSKKEAEKIFNRLYLKAVKGYTELLKFEGRV